MLLKFSQQLYVMFLINPINLFSILADFLKFSSGRILLYTILLQAPLELLQDLQW